MKKGIFFNRIYENLIFFKKAVGSFRKIIFDIFYLGGTMAIKYKWLAQHLETLIQKNIGRGIHKLPTEQELARNYHVSRQTVRMALSLLEQKGLISRRQGSGSYITGLTADPHENIIGILISSDQDYLYPGVLSDIRNTLSENGFSTQIFITDNCVQKERDILEQLLKDPLRGIIVEGCKSALPNPNLDLYRKLMKRKCQIVFLYNYYPALEGCLYVKDDNVQGSSLLVQHLVSQGHRAIGGIFKTDDMQGPERYQGFVETLRSLGLPFPDQQVCWYDSRRLDKLLHEKDTRFLKEMIRESLSPCSAVVCFNDVIAYYLIEELLLAGYRLPGDMAVAAFDNTYLSNSNILTVTTLSHKPHEMGRKAAQAILKKLNGLPVSPEEAHWELNLKASTLPAHEA